ncbi:LysR substrate binding domain-containing protein [Rhizobium sp. RU20A]|uniref:LysR substrate-binding domain-containing protein n=1 Tax=Rhizobium sp. RU20A TaxID=1907412 RepID=UPI0009566160|nr:LysR substrate-binding domain-containing protein [Rhizobium sp. RU20A]SIQ95713.1 LysR substrate binding domain-containing protein [Rhizobium sp. RU20A]
MHLDSHYYEGATWWEFLGHYGLNYTLPGGVSTFNNYILVVHAVLAGAGIGLGGQHSVGDLVASGALVRPLKEQQTTGNDFLLVYRKGRPLTPRAAAVHTWLLSLGSRST